MDRHVSVLQEEVIQALDLSPGKNIIDATLGDAGHAELILDHILPGGTLIGIDADIEAILRAKQFLYRFGNSVLCVRTNFSEIKRVVHESGIHKIDGILFDLGWSTPQFENRGRGFSFQKDEPLDMRYSTDKQQVTAQEIVNEYSEEQLAKIFREYGEEQLSKEIARSIAKTRKLMKIETSGELTEIVLHTYRAKLKTDKEVPWIGGLHPATKVFQAIRIEVNNELAVLKQSLADALDILAPHGRLVVISFHSLEDRIVKHFFKSQEEKTINILTKKPITCSKEEYEQNPPSRSAKLRIAQKI